MSSMELIGDGMFIYVESAEKLILKNNMTKSLQEFNKEKLEESRKRIVELCDGDPIAVTMQLLFGELLSAALADQAKMIEAENNTSIKLAGKDELYTDWFRCVKCGNELITRDSKYCPNCGRKIVKKSSTNLRN